MNSFGLGLVLNFVDNASSGMNSANRTFLQMSATADSMTASVNASAVELTAIAYSLNAVGDTFVNIGNSITGVFTGITQQVIDTGMTIQGYRMQLSALYGSVEAGEAKIEEIKQYAMSSVFDIQSLIPAVTMMKAVGIEAMQEVTTSSGQHTQKLLDYASDIAAMVPNMRNTYGTGVAAAMGALKEYIAEGNALTLKRGAGLDITGILGEDKGATIEERTKQVADLVEKLNIVGYTANLAGTPTQRLSNMQDALFNSLSKIADSGVFEVYCGLLEDLSNWVFSLVENEETFNTLTGVLADTITSLLSPLQSMLDWVIENGDALIEWIENHPKLTKNILLTVAAVGAFLVVGGSMLKMLSSVAFAINGLNMLKSLPKMISFASGAFGGLISRLSPFIALAGIAYFVWENNIFGIRDVITQAMKDIGTVFTLVSEAWNDNTLSVESYQKANELGILPLISSLLQLKYYWGYFTEGFNEGFESFFEGIAESLSWLKLLGIDINGIAQTIGNLLQSLLGIGAEDKWKAIGEAAGKFAALAVSILAVTKALTLMKTISSGLSSIGKIPFLSGLFGGKKTPIGGNTQSGGFLSNPKAVLKTMASLAIIIGGVALIITAMGALASIPGYKEFIPSGGTVLKTLFSCMSVVLSAEFWATLGAVALLGKLNIKTVALGVAGLATVIAGLALIVSAFAGLSMIEGFNEFIQSGGTSLALLFEQIGIAVGSLIGGIGEGITDSLPQIGDNISTFAENLKPFFDIVKDAPLDKVGSFLVSFAGAMLMLGGEKLLTLFTGKVNLPQLGTELSAFSNNASDFFTNVAKYPESGLTKAPKVFEALSGMGDYDFKTGGVAQFFTGSTNLTVIGQQLASFAPYGTTFFNTVAEYSDSGLDKSPKVFEVLSGMGDYDFKAGGIAQLLTGHTSLGIIGEQLAKFAPNGTTFFNAVAEYSEDGIRKSPKVFESLASIGNYNFKSGGLAQLFTGHTSLGIIGNQLASFAPDGSTFFNAVADFSEDGIRKSKLVFEAISSIGGYELKSGGIAQLFTGKVSLKKIGEQLSDFAEEVEYCFTTLAPLEVTKLTDIATGIDKLSSTTSSFSAVLVAEKVRIINSSDAIYSAFIQCTDNSLVILNNFVREGANTGRNLMLAIANGITANAYLIRNAVQNAVNSVTISVPNIANNAASQAKNQVSGKMVGLSTGGFVKTTGIAVLHPNEVVVNDNTTKRLQSFLGAFEDAQSSNTAVVSNSPTFNSTTVLSTPPVTSQIRSETPQKSEEVHNDYSVNFAAGSVVIKLSNASDAELEKAADKIMKIIARKQQLRAMAVRQ